MAKSILILSNTIVGLHSFRREVIKAIVDAGYKVIISVPDDDIKADYFRGMGCEIIQTVFNRRGVNPLADFKLMMSYRRLIKQLKPMAVLTYTIKPNVYGGLAARICRVPQLANVTGLGDAVENGGWLQKLTIGLYKLGVGKAQRVFFQNEGNRSFCIRQGIADANSILLPGSGVNLEYHTFQEYPTDEGKIRFLFIGRLLKDKGTEELFATAKVIKEKYPQTEFQIVGSVDGNYQTQLDELVNTGIIKFLGSQSDVRPFIGAVECTIMPSYHEGMSNVNLESAANGRPVITTNVPGCRETIDDMWTGYLVEARNTQSLIYAVERFIALPYSQKVMMGKNAREKVEKEFDRKKVVDAYIKEIEKIANV
jgi:galacturonosyltransferase